MTGMIRSRDVIAAVKAALGGRETLTGCVMRSNAVIDGNVIVNTGATIDHDGQIATHPPQRAARSSPRQVVNHAGH